MADDGGSVDGRPAEQIKPRRYGRLAFLGLALLAIGFAVWLGVEAVHAKSSLEDARHNAQSTKESLLQGNAADAAKWSGEARSDAEAARAASHSLPWNIAASVPWVGSPFKTGQ